MAKRKAYWKPEMKQVELAPEEAVLSGCKLGQPSGGKTTTCAINKAGCTLLAAGS